MGRAGRAPKQAVAATDDDHDDDNDTKCEGCGLGDDEPNLVLCDDCPRGWHVYCLRPKLPHVPRGSWSCPRCAPAATGGGGDDDARGSPAAPASGNRAKRRRTGTRDETTRSTRRSGVAAAGSTKAPDDDLMSDREGAEDDEMRTMRCVICDLGDDENKMVLCDGCDAGYHLYCLKPKLSQVPRGRWFCPACEIREDERRRSVEATAATKALRVAVANEYADGRVVRAILGSRLVPTTRLATLRADATRGAAFEGRSAEVEFLALFEHSSKRAAEWIPGCAVEVLTEGKLRYFWKRHDAGWDDPIVEPEYVPASVAPEKIVAVDDDEDRMLVKWAGEGYDEATWEPLADASDDAVADAAAAACARSATSPGGGKGKGKGKAARRVSSGGDKAEGFERADEPPADAGEAGDVGRRLRGTRVEGGGNAGIAAELREELDAFRARAARPRKPPRSASKWSGEKGREIHFDLDVVPALAAVAGAPVISANELSDGSTGAAPAATTTSADALVLHAYQRDGVRWLLNKLRLGASAILGDEMGLGKTVQTAVFVAGARAMGLLGDKPVLVVAPLSTVPNWMAELRKWCPALNRVGYIGNAAARETCRSFDFPNTTAGGLVDVVVTSYEVAIADSKELQRLRWGAVVVDEGHRLKNFQSRLSRVLSTLDSPFRCLLTGTPLQNNLEELFALLHFLEPEKFKNPPSLAESFTADAKALSTAGKGKGEGRDSATGDGDDKSEAIDAQLKSLHGLLGKRMLRRLKRDVLGGLPKMRKAEVACQLSPFQREVYADVLARNHKAFNQGAHARERTSLLNVLKELQKVCNHPFLFVSAEKDTFRAARKSGLAKKVAEEAEAERRLRGERRPGSPAAPDNPLEATLLRSSSGKMQLLAKLLPKLRERGHRILLFCQMTRMLDLLEDWLRASGVGFVVADEAPANSRNGSVRPVYGRIDGGTPLADRQRVIADFNTPGSDTFLLLISTRAGGQGVNLATADTIVLYDPDFNPFIDSQAQSRAHRMGQTREVAVYQLVTAKTVEEKIVSMAKSKLAIERLVVKDVRGEEGGGGKGKGG